MIVSSELILQRALIILQSEQKKKLFLHTPQNEFITATQLCSPIIQAHTGEQVHCSFSNCIFLIKKILLLEKV